MRACWALLLAGLAAAQTGCRAFERWQRDRDRPSTNPASRTRDPDWLKDRTRQPADSPYELPRDRERPRDPGNLLDPPTVPSSNVKVPAAGTWAGPTSKTFDLRGAAQRLISGVVETQDGRVVEGAFVALENADPTKNAPGAQVGVQTDRDGTFLIQGLKPGDTYLLTAQVKEWVGKQYVTVPNQQVRIQLRNDFGVAPLTGPSAAGDLPGSGTPSVPPPTSGVTPPPLFGSSTNAETLPFPANNDGSFSPVPSAPARPDLIAPGPQPDFRTKSPPVAIPGPGGVLPLPTTPPTGSTSKSIDRGLELKLLDLDGKERTLPTGRAGDLVLLNFASTDCVHCAKAIPRLEKLHDRYRDQAVEVLTVLCDEGSSRERLRAAESYRRGHRFPYGLAVEAKFGTAQDALKVRGYPTLVLLDGTGRTLWTGHPKDADRLERTVRDFLDSRAGR